MTIEYNDDIADTICDLIADGKSVRQICESNKHVDGFPSRSTILRWLNNNPAFEAKCARARILQAEENFDRTGEVIDNLLAGDIPPDVARVALGGLQWRAGRLNSKKYGDKTQTEVTSPDGSLSTMNETQLAAKLNAIHAAATKRWEEAEQDAAESD